MSEDRTLTVLVVEDEPDGQVVLSELLEFSNIHTHTVGTGEAALRQLEANTYQGAVIDLALPGMDGFTLLEYIRSHSNPAIASLPCVAVTAYHTSSIKKQALDNGFNGYVPKPIDRRLLLQELMRVIDTR